MISKKLLSTVLDIDVRKLDIDGDIIRINTDTFYDTFPELEISIYKLVYNCKKWAMKQGYHIPSILCGTNGTYDYGIARVKQNISSDYSEVYACDAKTEPEAVFKACEFILNSKEKQ